ncbi:MAG: carbohydrate-binding family 9-like protein [Lachnospiraceae bacterium]|nr:carbohydrate-binding family 9-like protein [Lachnospiraceae bacterium]
MITIARLEHYDEVERCERLPIAYKLWGTKKDIKAYGQMGYVENQELVVKMTAEEENPIATYEKEEDPVYLDSALEVFFSFDIENTYYINLEVNAKGAFLCHYGKRKDRGPILTKERVLVTANIEEKQWSVLLRIPYSLIVKCFGNVQFHKGSRISFNLYKICELQGEQHFISYTFIPTKSPDFHQPAYFAEGILG